MWQILALVSVYLIFATVFNQFGLMLLLVLSYSSAAFSSYLACFTQHWAHFSVGSICSHFNNSFSFSSKVLQSCTLQQRAPPLIQRWWSAVCTAGLWHILIQQRCRLSRKEDSCVSELPADHLSVVEPFRQRELNTREECGSEDLLHFQISNLPGCSEGSKISSVKQQFLHKLRKELLHSSRQNN